MSLQVPSSLSPSSTESFYGRSTKLFNPENSVAPSISTIQWWLCDVSSVASASFVRLLVTLFAFAFAVAIKHTHFPTFSIIQYRDPKCWLNFYSAVYCSHFPGYDVKPSYFAAIVITHRRFGSIWTKWCEIWLLFSGMQRCTHRIRCRHCMHNTIIRLFELKFLCKLLMCAFHCCAHHFTQTKKRDRQKWMRPPWRTNVNTHIVAKV